MSDRAGEDVKEKAPCEHDWTHLREVTFVNTRGTWGDEFFCRRCLTKRQLARD